MLLFALVPLETWPMLSHVPITSIFPANGSPVLLPCSPVDEEVESYCCNMSSFWKFWMLPTTDSSRQNQGGQIFSPGTFLDLKQLCPRGSGPRWL